MQGYNICVALYQQAFVLLGYSLTALVHAIEYATLDVELILGRIDVLRCFVGADATT